MGAEGTTGQEDTGKGKPSVRSDGLIFPDALLAQAGPAKYTYKELGLEGEGTVEIDLTVESLHDAGTIAAVRGATLVDDHPEQVTPFNYRQLARGCVVGEITAKNDGLYGDVLVADAEALAKVANGKKQLSLGYGAALKRKPDGGIATNGPLGVNHLAMVDKARRGPQIRLTDGLPPEQTPAPAEPTAEGDPQMTPEQLAEAVAKGLADAKVTVNDGTTDVKALIQRLLEPLHKDVTALRDGQAAAAAEAAAEEATKAFEADIVKRERARYQVLQDALPLIPEGQRTGLEQLDTKAILVMALKDHLPGADQHTEDYLHGVLKGMAAARTAPITTTGPQGALPPGVVTTPPLLDGITQRRQSARDQYKERQKARHLAAPTNAATGADAAN